MQSTPNRNSSTFNKIHVKGTDFAIFIQTVLSVIIFSLAIVFEYLMNNVTADLEINSNSLMVILLLSIEINRDKLNFWFLRSRLHDNKYPPYQNLSR